MEPGSKVTAPSSDSDDDLESLLTTTEFPWELSDSDEDYEQAWLEGEVRKRSFSLTPETSPHEAVN
jgi:hypothetical protein